MAIESMSTDRGNRRRMFRVDAEIGLFYKVIDADSPRQDDSADMAALGMFALTSELEILTLESRSLLRRLERRNRDVAEYFRILDRKIAVLGRAVLQRQGLPGDRAMRNVNLSASGLSFDAEEALEPGSILELKLILPPAFVAIRAHGNVVYCESGRRKDARVGCRVGVIFSELQEQDKQLLIRYIVRRKMQQLRNKKRVK